MDWELVFWSVALIAGIVFAIRISLEPQDLYYESNIDKIGGKGGRQASFCPGGRKLGVDKSATV